jgi:hypothetical protein
MTAEQRMAGLVPDNLDGSTPISTGSSSTGSIGTGSSSTGSIGIGSIGTGSAELVPESVHRRARRALVVNLVVAICCFGLLSVPGAVAAGMALRAIPDDLPRADRMIRWSWAFLGANLLFYLLLAAVILTFAVIVFLASRSGS